MDNSTIIWRDYKSQKPEADGVYFTVILDDKELEYRLQNYYVKRDRFVLYDSQTIFWAELPKLPRVEISFVK